MKNLALLLLVAAGLTACSDDDADAIGCTEEFRTVSFSVESDNLPAEVYYREAGSAQRVTLDALNSDPARYVLKSDADLDEHQNVTKTYTVEGTDANGNVLFNEIYEITGDECHISKVSGPEVISY